MDDATVREDDELDVLRSELEQLRSALRRRPVIDLAKGAVMALTGCDEDTAFRRLSAASQTHNVKLFDVSTALVADLPRLARGDSPTGGAAVAAVLDRRRVSSPRPAPGQTTRASVSRPQPPSRAV